MTLPPLTPTQIEALTQQLARNNPTRAAALTAQLAVWAIVDAQAAAEQLAAERALHAADPSAIIVPLADDLTIQAAASDHNADVAPGFPQADPGPGRKGPNGTAINAIPSVGSIHRQLNSRLLQPEPDGDPDEPNDQD